MSVDILSCFLLYWAFVGHSKPWLPLTIEGKELSFQVLLRMDAVSGLSLVLIFLQYSKFGTFAKIIPICTDYWNSIPNVLRYELHIYTVNINMKK